MSTEGGNGREDGEGRVDAPDRNPKVMLSVSPGMLPFTPLNVSSSSARRFLRLWIAPEADPLCVCSDRAGGRRERDNSGFCSLCRRKWAFRFPLVVNRLKQTGHWYGLSPVCDRRWIWREESLLNTFPQKRQTC